MKKVSTRLLAFILLAFADRSFSQQLAFPTAEGAGRFTSGGRGTAAVPTTVFEVTRLDDPSTTNPPVGTFRYACTNNSPAAVHRTVVFRVSGTIRLTGPLSLNRANTTIAGQTAPGDGICIADYPVSISADNLIVRFIRFRLGDRYQAARIGNDDAFSGTGRKKIIIDHCTMSWSDDEAFTVYDGDSTTLQWNMISEPLDYSYHDEGAGIQHHGYGGIWGGRRTSAHHNLIAHVRGRAPRFSGSRNLPNSTTPVAGSENLDFTNNVIYDWVDYNVNGGEGGNYNVVNNYYKYGPNTLNSGTTGVNRRNMVINPYKQTSPVLPYGKYYLTGNYVDNSAIVTADNWLGAAMGGGSLADTNQTKVETPFNIAPLNSHTATEAYELVLQHAGATLPKRDTLDQRIVNDVRNRTGRIIDVQGGYPVGTTFDISQSAWPTLNSLPAPADTDHDGMPDDWENSNGLNPNDASDRNAVGADDYTMLEKYLNNIITQAVLPLKVVLFNGSVIQSLVKLNWTISDAVNTGNFSIERSTDGSAFHSIGLVEVNNVSSNASSYSFTDAQSLTGKTYYRLRINNKVDSFTYSPVISFNTISKGVLSVNPNPVKDHITVSHSAASAMARLQVYSLDGKLKLSYKIGAGAVQTSFDVAGLSSGLYSLVFINNNEKSVEKFVKQ